MSLKQEVELLRDIALFANLEASKLKLLAFTSEWLTYEPGYVLCRQGEPGDAAYVIVEGVVDILVDSPEGPVVVAERTSDIIGEIAILCDVPRTATVQAKTRVYALKISKEVFRGLVMSSPKTAMEIIRILAERLQDATDKLQEAKAAAL